MQERETEDEGTAALTAKLVDTCEWAGQQTENGKHDRAERWVAQRGDLRRSATMSKSCFIVRTLVGRDKYQQYTLHVAHWLRINKRRLCGRTESGRLITGGFHRNNQYNRSGQVSVVRIWLTLWVLLCFCVFKNAVAFSFCLVCLLFVFLSFHISVVVFLVSF